MCPRVTGYNRMSRKLSIEQAELMSECHLSIYLLQKLTYFRKTSCYLLYKIVSFFAPPHPGICQMLAIHCSDVSDVWPLYLPLFSLTFVTLSATSYLELQWSSDSLLGLPLFPCHPAHLKSSTWKRLWFYHTPSNGPIDCVKNNTYSNSLLIAGCLVLKAQS